MRFPTLHFTHPILDLPRGTKEVNQAILLPTDGLPPFVNISMQNSIYRQIEHKGVLFESRRMACVQPTCPPPHIAVLFSQQPVDFRASCPSREGKAIRSRRGCDMQVMFRPPLIWQPEKYNCSKSRYDSDSLISCVIVVKQRC